MTHGEFKIATIKPARFILYLCFILIVVRVAANISHDPHTKDPELYEKIVAFKKNGVERSVNTDHYDAEGVIDFAESLIGTPHLMGGYSRSGLDCSGLVKLAHEQFDISLPHSSQEQARYGTIISPGQQLRRGDLVFFHSTYSTPKLVTHSGIYLGENKFIHTSTAQGVSISVLLDSGYWQKHYLFATRIDD